jgi:hypothetical protein
LVGRKVGGRGSEAALIRQVTHISWKYRSMGSNGNPSSFNAPHTAHDVYTHDMIHAHAHVHVHVIAIV